MSPGAEETSGQSPRVDSPLPVSFASAGVGESPRRRPGLGDVKSAAEAAALDDYDALFKVLIEAAHSSHWLASPSGVMQLLCYSSCSA